MTIKMRHYQQKVQYTAKQRPKTDDGILTTHKYSIPTAKKCGIPTTTTTTMKTKQRISHLSDLLNCERPQLVPHQCNAAVLADAERPLPPQVAVVLAS